MDMASEVYVDGKFVPRNAWDCAVTTSKKSLAEFSAALLLTHTLISCSFKIGNAPLGRGVDSFWRLWIPEGQEVKFQEICPKAILTLPPKVAI